MKHQELKSEEAAVVMGITNVAVCLTVIIVAFIGSCSFDKRTDASKQIVGACTQNLATKGEPSAFCKEYLLK